MTIGDTKAVGFDEVYRAWLTRVGLVPEGAARVVGVARSVSYSYATGASAPADTRLPFLASVMGMPESDLRAAAVVTRQRVKKARQNAARQGSGRLHQRKQVLNSNANRGHAATIRRGRS